MENIEMIFTRFNDLAKDLVDLEGKDVHDLGSLLVMIEAEKKGLDEQNPPRWKAFMQDIEKCLKRLILLDIDPIDDASVIFERIYRGYDLFAEYVANTGKSEQLDYFLTNIPSWFEQDTSEGASLALSPESPIFAPESVDSFYQDLAEQEQSNLDQKSDEDPNGEDTDIFLDFLQEAHDYVQILENEVIDLEDQPQNKEIINNVFRPFHTLKGVSGFMGLKVLNLISHETESLLDHARNDRITIDSQVIQAVLQSLDFIKAILSRLTPDDRREFFDENKLKQHLEQLRITVTEKQARYKQEIAQVVQPTESMSDDSPADESKKGQDNRVRIKTEKLDFLVDMVGELVINANLVRMDRNIVTIADQDFRKKFSQLNRVVGELQNASMSLRMVPISITFNRMKRVVRDYTFKTGKDIALVLKGEETEIDRGIVDSLYDPLVHMIRNSCDHGIESEQERSLANKSKKGMIELQAYHHGNHIVIEVNDDGKGLDKDRIMRKAIERGLADPGQNYPDSDIFNFIFEAGFSTVDKITNVSGRGVGMDVVRQTIRQLGGSIGIESTPGAGTRFSIHLPLTLAIIQGMLVKVGNELYILPVVNVRRTLKPSSAVINKIVGKGETVKLEEKLLPIARLHRIFEIDEAKQRIEDGLLIVVSTNNREYCIMVDELVGIQDIVIKSLGEKFANLSGISGATILGDGSVGLILDINSLCNFGSERI